MYAISECVDYKGAYHNSIRSKKHKLYGHKLFDLEYDPLEQRNISDRNREACKFLQKRLDDFLNSREPLEVKKATINSETLKSLKSLGYVN